MKLAELKKLAQAAADAEDDLVFQRTDRLNAALSPEVVLWMIDIIEDASGTTLDIPNGETK